MSRSISELFPDSPAVVTVAAENVVGLSEMLSAKANAEHVHAQYIRGVISDTPPPPDPDVIWFDSSQ